MFCLESLEEAETFLKQAVFQYNTKDATSTASEDEGRGDDCAADIDTDEDTETTSQRKSGTDVKLNNLYSVI